MGKNSLSTFENWPYKMVNWINLKSGQTLTITGTGTLKFYVLMNANSKLNLNGDLTLNHNVWGPGSLCIGGNITMNASVGVSPPAGSLTPKGLEFPGTNVTVDVSNIF